MHEPVLQTGITMMGGRAANPEPAQTVGHPTAKAPHEGAFAV